MIQLLLSLSTGDVYYTSTHYDDAGPPAFVYSNEDIKDGCLVFTDVRSVRFEPSGPLPNDLINDVSVKALDPSGSQPSYFFELSIGSVDDTGNSTEVLVKIEAGDLHLEDPAKPGVEITS